MLAAGLGAYEPAGTVNYGVGDALRYGVYHAADLLLLVGVLPACAVVALALAVGGILLVSVLRHSLSDNVERAALTLAKSMSIGAT